MADVPGPVAAVLEAAGGSLIAEELKGDLAAARAAAEAALESGQQEAEAALAVSLAAALQGDARTTELRLEGASEGPLPDALERLARELRWNAFPGGEGAGGLQLLLQRATEMGILGNRTVTGAGLEREAALVREAIAGGFANRQLLGSCRVNGLAEQIPGILDMGLGELAPLEGGPWAAYGALAAARLLRGAGRHEEARERLDLALGRYGSAADAAGMGVCHLVAGDWLAAPYSSPEAWNLALYAGDGAGSALPPEIEAQEGTPRGDAAAAAAAYDAAAACFAGAARGFAAVELRRAYLAVLDGDAAGAAARAEQARAGFSVAGDRLGEQLALAHRVLAEVLAGTTNADEAAARSIGVWGLTEGSFAYANGLAVLFGRAARRWERLELDPDRALAGYRLAREAFAGLGATSAEAQCLVDQAQLLRLVGDWAGASVLLEEASALNERTFTAIPESRLMLRQYFLAGERRAIAVDRTDADALERLNVALNVQLERLAAVADGSTEMIVRVLRDCTTELLEESAVQVPLLRLITARRAREDWNVKAELQAALEAAARVTYGAERLRAIVHKAAGDTALALEAMRRYLASPDATEPTPCTAVLGAQAERDALVEQATLLATIEGWEDAEQRFAALEQAEGPNWWETETRAWSVLDVRGQVRQGCGDLDGALKTYEQAIEQLERTRERLTQDELRSAQAGLQNANRPFLHAARAAQLAAEQPAVAGDAASLRTRSLALAERGRARALLDIMATTGAIAQGAGEQHAWIRMWRELTARLALGRRLLAEAVAAGDAARVAELETRVAADGAALRALEEAHPRWREVVSPKGRVLAVEEIAAHLPPDTVLLEYMLDERQLLGWAVERDGLTGIHHRPFEPDALGIAIERFAEMCLSRWADWEPTAAELGEILLGPFREQIARNRRVLVVPSGAAHRLPWPALTWEGAPFGASRPLTILPSASALGYLDTGKRTVSGPVFAVGGPTEDLPWSVAEAAWIASQFPGSPDPLLEAEGTQEAVLAGIARYPVIHVSSHAQLAADAPLMSELLLANGENLELSELLGLDLGGTDLVVLSACETARGEVTSGEEVIGLTRGLLAAGARDVVASLWRVSAESTPLLMRAFYQRLLDGQAPADALQGAQQHLRGLDEDAALQERQELQAIAEANGIELPPVPQLNYAHPYHWAPFVFVGA